MCMSRNTKKGHIVIVSSLSAHVPLPGQTAYSATKAALRVQSPSTPAEYSQGLCAQSLRAVHVLGQIAMPRQNPTSGPQFNRSISCSNKLSGPI